MAGVRTELAFEARGQHRYRGKFSEYLSFIFTTQYKLLYRKLTRAINLTMGGYHVIVGSVFICQLVRATKAGL